MKNSFGSIWDERNIYLTKHRVCWHAWQLRFCLFFSSFLLCHRETIQDPVKNSTYCISSSDVATGYGVWDFFCFSSQENHWLWAWPKMHVLWKTFIPCKWPCLVYYSISSLLGESHKLYSKQSCHHHLLGCSAVFFAINLIMLKV